jgi:hypothetical protein
MSGGTYLNLFGKRRVLEEAAWRSQGTQNLFKKEEEF